MTDDSDSAEEKRARADARFATMTRADWARIHKELIAFGLARSGSPALAADLAQEAMMRVLDARWEPWDPAKQPSLEAFLKSIMNRNLSNERKIQKGHRELRMAAEQLDALGGDAPTPEALLVARARDDARVRALRARLEGDAEAVELLGLFERGVETPEEQRVATGKAIAAVRNARRRLFFHAENVRRELDGGGDVLAKSAGIAGSERPLGAPPKAAVIHERPKRPRVAAARGAAERRAPARAGARGKPDTRDEEES